MNISLPARIQKSHLSEHCSLTCPLQESKVKFRYTFNVYRSIGQIQEIFLQQTQYLKDNVYTRVADLTAVNDVLAADIYHHNICVICYRNKYNKFKAVSERKSVKSNAQIKFDLFKALLNGLEKCLEQGY